MHLHRLPLRSSRGLGGAGWAGGAHRSGYGPDQQRDGPVRQHHACGDAVGGVQDGDGAGRHGQRCHHVEAGQHAQRQQRTNGPHQRQFAFESIAGDSGGGSSGA